MKLVLSLCLLVVVMFSSSEALIPRRCKSLTVPENSYLTGDWGNFQEGRTVGIKCVEGYELKGANEAFCKNGQWTNPLGKCKDSELPVFKDCYQDPIKRFTVDADPGKATAKVRLPVFSYSDNSEAHGGKLRFSATLDGKPISVTEELELGINLYSFGRHYVRYTVTDEAENVGICRMSYRVEDKEPPKIKNCPSDIIKTIIAGKSSTARVAWKEPTVTDNSGEDPSVICNRVNGSQFPEGKYLVIYRATDRAQNEAVCEFNITVNVKYPCVDHSMLAAALLAPTPADPNNACSFLASDRKQCENAVGSFMPDVLWKQVCRKTCTDC